MNEEILCNQKTDAGLCGKPAIEIMHWFGEGDQVFYVCEGHKARAIIISMSLAFGVSFEPIPKECP